ncbi:MAG: hypothetical protein LBI53_06510 [Candidatus Peribacteria bacterium]|jgi:hypothetical protein|nr:hypothetical protein [Candidatus Peribacteria bacterium]
MRLQKIRTTISTPEQLSAITKKVEKLGIMCFIPKKNSNEIKFVVIINGVLCAFTATEFSEKEFENQFFMFDEVDPDFIIGMNTD